MKINNDKQQQITYKHQTSTRQHDKTNKSKSKHQTNQNKKTKQHTTTMHKSETIKLYIYT